MKSWEFKLGTVYRYHVSGDLYVVVKMLNELDGSHEWLCLTGEAAGRTGDAMGGLGCNEDRWSRFSLQVSLMP